eukprot:6641119-Prymnesium_polylepis.1
MAKDLSLTDIPAAAKTATKSEKVLAYAPLDAHVALVLNALLRTCSPPKESKESPAKDNKGGKEQANSIKAAAAKVVEGDPPTGPEVRKTLKANVKLLAEVTHGTAAGQLALLKALQSWLVSPQGANALAGAAKIVE